MDDPFAVLGLPSTATLAEVRAARRRLARTLHPDHGGDEARMQEVNRAFDLAVKALLRPPGAGPGAAATSPTPPATASSTPPATGVRRPTMRRHLETDSPSFSIELLPVEAYEALLIVVSWVGETLVDDPPYLLDAHLLEPEECWCRIELAPEAGATTVSLTVAGLDGGDAPPVDDVRDLLVSLVNQLGRPTD